MKERLTKSKWTNDNCKPVYDKNGDIVMDKELFDLLITEHNLLAEYEDDEESGKIVRLPCKVGDTIFGIYEFDAEEDDCYEIYPVRVREIHIRKDDIWLEIKRPFVGKFVSEKICFTREEAEKRLKELQE